MNIDQILAGLSTVAGTLDEVLSPNAKLLVTLAQNGLALVRDFQQTGTTDVTDEQLNALFVDYDAARLDDLEAQSEVQAKQDVENQSKP